MLRAEEFRSDTTEISGVKIGVTSYRIGNRYHCHVANADPGATIARADGDTREEALQRALTKATERLTGREEKTL